MAAKKKKTKPRLSGRSVYPVYYHPGVPFGPLVSEKIFTTYEKAVKFVIRHAKAVYSDWDDDEAKACRNGVSEYACAKGGCRIDRITLE
jgi:hypothetical protein